MGIPTEIGGNGTSHSNQRKTEKPGRSRLIPTCFQFALKVSKRQLQRSSAVPAIFSPSWQIGRETSGRSSLSVRNWARRLKAGFQSLQRECPHGVPRVTH